MSVLRNKIFSVRSDEREEGENEDFVVSIKNGGESWEGNHLAYLKRATIPRSWYSLEENDSFLFEENGFSPVEASVPEGTYTYAEFRTAIENALNAVASSNASGRTYTVAFDNVTAKYTYTETGGNDFEFDFTTNANNKAYRYADHMGFIRESQNTSGGGIGGVLTSTRTADTFGTKNLYLLCPSSSMVGLYEHFQNGGGRNVLSVIQVPQNKWGIINVFNSDPKGSRRIWRNPTNNRLRIRLVDDEGDTINLRGVSWQIEINFQSR